MGSGIGKTRIIRGGGRGNIEPQPYTKGRKVVVRIIIFSQGLLPSASHSKIGVMQKVHLPE